jgi:hypothetical protein
MRVLSLFALLWFGIHVYARQKAFDILWPPTVRMAGRINGTYAIDVPLPLPVTVWFLIYAIPTVVVGCLFLLYRSGTKGQRQPDPRNKDQCGKRIY